MGAVRVRRRTGLPRGTGLLAEARGSRDGLLPPCRASTRMRRHAHLDVVLVPGILAVAGRGGHRRSQVADTMSASADEATGALRVDFPEGDPLVVRVRDDDALPVGLCAQIEEHECVLRSGRDDLLALGRVPV
jgi:hypothetical protein